MPKSRMSFERGLTRFRLPHFRFSDLSQKRPFLRADSAGVRGRYRVAGQVPGSPSLICLSMPARSLRSRTRRAFARGPAALLDLRSARRPWGIRSGRRNDQSPIEQRNWETLEAQAGMAIAGSNGLPVFSTPKQITSSLRIAATTICLGLRRPACFRRATSAMMAGL